MDANNPLLARLNYAAGYVQGYETVLKAMRADFQQQLAHLQSDDATDRWRQALTAIQQITDLLETLTGVKEL